LLALVGEHGRRPELDPLDGPPGLGLAAGDLDAVESGVLQGLEEQVLAERARDAARPQLGVATEVVGHVLVGDDVAERDPAAPAEDAEGLGEEPAAVLRPDEVEDAVGDDAVDALVLDQRVIAPEGLLQRPEPEPALAIADRPAAQLGFEAFEVEAEVLDHPAPELDVGEAQPRGHGVAVAPGESEHLGVAVDADDPPAGADDLGRDVAGLAAAGAEVEHGVARPEVGRRVAAAVIAAEDLLGDGLQEARIVGDRAAELRLDLARRRRVAVPDRGFDVDGRGRPARVGGRHGRRVLGVSCGIPRVGPAPGGIDREIARRGMIADQGPDGESPGRDDARSGRRPRG